MVDTPRYLIVDGVPAVLPRVRTLLSDGCTGWYQRGIHDCLRAALATLCQEPYDEVEEVRDRGALEAWAAARDLAIQVHVNRPDAERWIGFAPLDENGQRHTVVGVYNRVYFDPASGWVFPGGRHVDPVRVFDFAVTFESC